MRHRTAHTSRPSETSPTGNNDGLAVERSELRLGDIQGRHLLQSGLRSRTDQGVPTRCARISTGGGGEAGRRGDGGTGGRLAVLPSKRQRIPTRGTGFYVAGVAIAAARQHRRACSVHGGEPRLGSAPAFTRHLHHEARDRLESQHIRVVAGTGVQGMAMQSSESVQASTAKQWWSKHCDYPATQLEDRCEYTAF